MFHVTIKGSELSEKLLFPELVRPRLTVQDIDAIEYENIFNQLSNDEKMSVMTTSDSGYYSDGTKALPARGYTACSYYLNKKLYEERPLEDDERKFVRNLNNVIKKLPHTTGDFIRISEYSSSPNDNPWINDTINVGDVVTNTPAFMSVSDDWAYVEDTLDGFTLLENTTTYALFKFVNSNQFAPLLRGVASLCVDENEHLAPIGSAFRVTGVAYAKPVNEHSDLKVRVSVLLEDTSRMSTMKNIHTGELYVG